MSRTEELGLSEDISHKVKMDEEWFKGINDELSPALDLVERHLNSGFKNPGGEYFNLSWPMGHTPYIGSPEKKAREAEGVYEEHDFGDYILNCNHFTKRNGDKYIVHGMRVKEPEYIIGPHIQRLVDTIAHAQGLQDKHVVMLVMYKGPEFCMQWHNDTYTQHRYQIPLTSNKYGLFGWQYTHEDGEVEEAWTNLEKGHTYWVNTQNVHIFDNSRPGCAGRIHFMIDYLDWEPHYEDCKDRKFAPTITRAMD